MRVAKFDNQFAAGSGGPEFKILYSQLNRLDPANRSLAVHGFVDINLSSRSQSLQKIMDEKTGCPRSLGIDHIHRGKRDDRQPTKVSIIEFRNNADREQAFKLMQDSDFKDGTGAKITSRGQEQPSRRSIMIS